jgi:hypothetical protein
MDAPNAASASLPVSTVLRNAAELIEKKGWCQFRFLDEDGGTCLAGAGEASAKSVSGWWQAREFLHRYLDIDPTIWNDAPERTQAEVVAKLREAAALAESEGR